MYLAIGVCGDYSWTVFTDSVNPQVIADVLYELFVDPEQIILLENDKIIEHWHVVEDYNVTE